MCWTLLPQSLCMHCGTHVNFAILRDPCDIVISESLPFGACGDENYRVVLGPEDALCDICLIPEGYFDNLVNKQYNTQYSPAVQTGSYPGPTSFGGARARPFPCGGSFRGQRQRYTSSRHALVDDSTLSNTMASPFQPQNPAPVYHGHVNCEIHSQGQRRSQTPYPATFSSDSEPEHSSSTRSSNGGGARLSSSSYYYTSSEEPSSLDSSNPPTHPRLTLPGADSPFGFGYTPARRVPNPSPATTSFLSAHLDPSGTQHLPPLPSFSSSDEAWIPAEWPPAVPMPPDLAHELDYTTADCVFHRHRVYFIAGREGGGDGSVIVVKPNGHEAHVVSYALYERTSAAVNRREDDAARWAREKARQERIAGEIGRRMRMGVCIHHPCRVAGCQRWHEEGQHQPLTPRNMGAFLRANRSAGEETKKGARFDADDVFGDEYEGDDVHEAGPSRVTRTPSPRPQRPTAQDDETPSTIHLSAGRNSERAPVQLVEKDGEVRRRPLRDPAAILTGSPAPRARRLAPARPSSSSPGQTAAEAGGEHPREAEREDGRHATELLDEGLDLADLRIGEEGESELRMKSDEEETY